MSCKYVYSQIVSDIKIFVSLYSEHLEIIFPFSHTPTVSRKKAITIFKPLKQPNDRESMTLNRKTNRCMFKLK
jgi:hypothetical protein